MIHLTRPLTAFDLETTSAAPQTARIVQIGIVRLHPDGTRDTYASLVNPEVPIPAEATAIHKITDAMVADKPTWRQLAPKLIRAFQGCDFLGYNIARFDLEVIGSEFKRVGVDTTVPPGQPKPRIFDAYVLWTKKETRTLSDASRRFLHHFFDEAHDALADVETTIRVAEAQLAEWPDLPKTIEELHALQFPTNPNAIDEAARFVWADGVPTLNFGKHKGTALARVDRGFLKWMLNQDFNDDTKQIARDAMNGRYPVKQKEAA